MTPLRRHARPGRRKNIAILMFESYLSNVQLTEQTIRCSSLQNLKIGDQCFHRGTDVVPKLQNLGYLLFDADRITDNYVDATNFVVAPLVVMPARRMLMTVWNVNTTQ